MPRLPRSQEELVRQVRRAMDSLALELQRHPGLSRLLRRARGVMIWGVKRFLPAALERRELLQARRVMADAPPQPETGTKVLIMSFRAWTSHLAWETTIAQALRHRGARCEFFFCGGGLPICEIGWPAAENGKPCEFCAPYTAAMIDAAKFPRISLNDVVPEQERQSILDRVGAAAESGGPILPEGVSLDEMVEQSLVWHFRSGTLPDTPEVRRARRDFLAGAAVMAVAAPRLLDRVKPDVVLMVNGQFYEERIVREEAAARSVRVVTYEVGAQRGTLFFSEGIAPDYDISGLWKDEKAIPLSEEEDQLVEEALESRRGGGGLSRQFYRRTTDFHESGDRPLLALFTNVSWDTAVTGKSFAFPTMFDWVAASIRHAQRHPVDLVIRVHPAESRWPKLESRERLASFVAREFPALPTNVRIVRPEDSVDSYALMRRAAGILVFSSTVGLEAAASGRAVAVAGKTHYRGRGFTIDVESPEEYGALFDDLTWTQPDAARQALARKYAYLFFFQAIVPFPSVVEEEPSEPIFTFSSVADLVPGCDPALDFIAERILAGGPFWLPESLARSDGPIHPPGVRDGSGRASA